MNLQKYILKLLILTILLGAMVVACSSDETSEKASPVPEPDPVVEIDNDGPNVVANAVVPSNNSTGVSIGTSVKFAFDESIEISSVTTATNCGATVQLSLNNFSSCVPLRSQIDVGNDNRSFTVYPVGNLEYNTKYVLKLTKLIQDSAGNYLANDSIPLIFTTAAENTISLTDSVMGEFEQILRTAAGYSASQTMRSKSRSVPITSTQIDSIVTGAKIEIANSGLSRSEELNKILEAMLIGSMKGMAGKVTTSSVRKPTLSAVSFGLVKLLPGREKFYTDNSSVIVTNLLKTGVSQLSFTQASNDDVPDAVGGILEGLISALGTLSFSESERVNKLVPELLNDTVLITDKIYTSAESSFWESMHEQIGEVMVTGMNNWNDWSSMESRWNNHLSAGISSIISNMKQIDGIVPSSAEGFVEKSVYGLFSGSTKLNPGNNTTIDGISESVGSALLESAKTVSFGNQYLNLEKTVLRAKVGVEKAYNENKGKLQLTIVTKLVSGINSKAASSYPDIKTTIESVLSGGNTVSEFSSDNVISITSYTSVTNDSTPTIFFDSKINGTVSDNCSGSTIAAIVGNNSITLGFLTDKQYDCSLTITDYAGGTEITDIPRFTIDTTKPNISDFSIISNTSATISATLDASDSAVVASYYLSESNTEPTIADTNWQSYSSRFINYSFANAVAEKKTLYAWVRDQAGNVSSAATATVQLQDNAAPSNLNISIANGTSHVNSETVKVSIGGTDNFIIGEMLLTEFSQSTPSSSDSRWQNYSTSATYTFLENPIGTKTIYLWLKDTSNNISTSAQDSVTIDLEKPNTASIKFVTADNATFTTIQTVTLLLESTDNRTNDSGIAGYYYSENSTQPSIDLADWRSTSINKIFSTTLSYKLSDGTGSKTLYAWFKDLAGNVSTVKSVTIENRAVPNAGDPVTLAQKLTKYSIKPSQDIYSTISTNQKLTILEDDNVARVTELFDAIIRKVDNYSVTSTNAISSIKNDNVTLDFYGEQYVNYNINFTDNLSFMFRGLDNSSGNFSIDNSKAYEIHFSGANVGSTITISRLDSSNATITTSSKTVTLADNFEPHVAVQHSNHSGQDTSRYGQSDNVSSPNVTSKMIIEFDANPTNVASTFDKMIDLYYYPKFNLTSSLYDKFGFRDLADNSSLATIALSAEDLDNISYNAVSDQRLKNSEITPLLAVNSPGSSLNAFGTTSTGRSDEFYTTADYNAWATTQTIPAGPTCLYYTADLSNVTGSFTGSWYPSNSAGTATTGASPISDNDSSQNTIPTTLAGYSISSTYTVNLTGGSTASANILRGPLGCGTLSQTVQGFVRSVKVSLTEPISQITNLSNFASTTGALGQINIPTGELSQNIIGITAVDGKDHMNIQLTDWRTIDASKHFTSDNQTVVANTESGGISKESLMQIVGMSDSDNVSATAGNGRGVVFVDASPPLATSITTSDTQSEIKLSITFDQPVLAGKGFVVHGYGDNGSTSARTTYVFEPIASGGSGSVYRSRPTSSVFDNTGISSATYTSVAAGNTLTVSIPDNATNDYSNFFNALSHQTTNSLNATDNVSGNNLGDNQLDGGDPTFFLNYDNITDYNYNSWNIVEYYDSYITNLGGPLDNRSNQFGPRLVGSDSLVPKMIAKNASVSNDNVFLMEVTDHGLQIISAFGTGADNGSHLMGEGIYFDDNGTTTTGDVNNTIDNSSTAVQNDYPLYRFWNSAGTNAQDNASANNNTRTRAVITFASGTVLKDDDSDGKAYIKGYLDNDNTSLTSQTTTALMRKSATLANGFTVGLPVSAGAFSVDNNTKLIVGIPNYTFTTDNTTADKTSVGSDDILVIDGIEVNGVEYVLHLSPPSVANSDTGLTATVSSGSSAYPNLKVYRKVYLDVNMVGMAADNKTNSNDRDDPRELTFNFLENIASASATYTAGSPINMTGVDFTESASVSSNNRATISLSDPTGTTDSAGRYVGDGAQISLTATDFSGNSNTYSLTFKLGHNQELPITNVNDIGDFNPIHNLIGSTANSSKRALQAP